MTAGTILHGSKLALTVWFWAAYLMATHSNGIAALQLQNQLGIGSYRSAWLLAAKLRKAMVDPERDPLSGLIEVDETALAFRPRMIPSGGTDSEVGDGKLPAYRFIDRYAAAPVETVIGSMAACCPDPSNLKGWARGVYPNKATGCAPSTCKAISTSSCSASTGAGHATPPSARCSASPYAPSPSPTTCWSGRKLVHKRSIRNFEYA